MATTSKPLVMAGMAFLASGSTLQAASPEEPIAVIRGTDGLERVPFHATNISPETISCGIATAHWYSVDLGTAEPNGDVRRDLWTSPKTGELFVLNDKSDRMPVLTLWCGFAGHAWVTRSAVTLERRAGVAIGAIDLRCRADDGKLSCR